MKTLNGKTVFITGGSSGVGLAAAKLVSAGGASVAIFARKSGPLEKALEEIRSCAVSEKQRFYCLNVDVSDHGDVRDKMAVAVDAFGVPDVLVTCAGVGLAKRFRDQTADEFNALMSINVNGTWNTVSALVPPMAKNGGGVVMVVASLAGLVPVYGYTAYGTSKYALVGFAECLRQELRRDRIRVQVLCPPEIDTPFVAEEQKTSPPETRLLKKLGGTLDVEPTARILVQGLLSGSPMIIPGFKANLVYFGQRFMPGWLMRSSTDLLVRLAGTGAMRRRMKG